MVSLALEVKVRWSEAEPAGRGCHEAQRPGRRLRMNPEVVSEGLKSPIAQGVKQGEP